VTREHPPAGVSPCNWQDVAVGVVLAPKMAKHSDGFEYVEGLLDITRQDASDAVTQGESELSAGYQVVLDPNPGVVPPGEPDAGKRYDAKRVSITPNHVAILGRGRARAGREARLLLDSIDDEDVLRLDADGDQIARNVIAEIEKSLGYREAPKQAWQQPGAHPHAEQIAALEKSRSDWQAYEKARAGETEAFNVKLRGLHGRELQGLVK
jgi:hypothetical protein